MSKYNFSDKEHLHTLDDKPLTGTSTVCGVLNKPLSWWASGKACEVLGWSNSKHVSKEDRLLKADNSLNLIKEMDTDLYLKLLDSAYKNHATSLKDSAKKGTDLHAELEDYVKGEMGIKPKRKYDERIKPFQEWAYENVTRFVASEANCYSETHWLGGIIDAVVELRNGSLALIDFKSSKAAYDSHFIQLGGYAIQSEENGLWDATGTHNKKLHKEISQLIVVPFGAEKVEPALRLNVKEYKTGFLSALQLYRLLN